MLPKEEEEEEEEEAMQIHAEIGLLYYNELIGVFVVDGTSL